MKIEKPVNKIFPICYYIGLIIMTLGALQLIPAVISAVYSVAQPLPDASQCIWQRSQRLLDLSLVLRAAPSCFVILTWKFPLVLPDD